MEDKGEDKRFGRINAQVIIALRTERGWTIDDFLENARKNGVLISKATVKRIENPRADNNRRLATIRDIAKVYGVKPKDITLGSSVAGSSGGVQSFPTAVNRSRDNRIDEYTWEDLRTGASRVAAELYDADQLKVDAVLTFPGPSSIFCGLVLAMLPPEVFMAIPVYTAVFMDGGAKLSDDQIEHFLPVHGQFFTMLVPKELVAGEKRIIVIDDVIISGGFIKMMRGFFKRHKQKAVRFACCICLNGLLVRAETEKRPDIIGLEKPRERRDEGFPMPWGRDSFSFEDVFHLRSEMLKGSPDQNVKN